MKSLTASPVAWRIALVTAALVLAAAGTVVAGPPPGFCVYYEVGPFTFSGC